MRIYNDKRIELINLENVYAIIIPLDSLNDARPLLKCVQSFLVRNVHAGPSKLQLRSRTVASYIKWRGAKPGGGARSPRGSKTHFFVR